MKYYELATLSTVIFGAGKAAPLIEEYVKAPEAKGTLLGAWFSDIGSLNEVYILRGFETQQDLLDERERAHRSDNPFGCMDLLTDLKMESFTALDFLPPVETGEFGPIYEIRTYNMRLNALNELTEKWEDAMPGRSEYSPLSIAMYATDGTPRLTQVWPYKSLEDRTKARAQSVADGKWPPVGGPDCLTTDMTSTIALPLGFSPLK